MLTVTRSCLACGSTGGQSQKVPVPSRVAADALLRLRPPSYPAPVSWALAISREVAETAARIHGKDHRVTIAAAEEARRWEPGPA